MTSVPTPTPATMPRAIRWRLGAILWLSGMSGLAALLWSLAPPLQDHGELLTQPVWRVLLFSGLLGALLLALAVAVGLLLAPRLGLGAPVLCAWLERRPVAPVLRAQLLPGLCGGLGGGAWLWALARIAPDAFAPLPGSEGAMQLLIDLPGTIGAELLLRWGLMTLLLWLAWRLLQRGQGAPGSGLVALAVLLVAALYACALPGTEYALTGLWSQPTLLAALGDFALGLLAGGLYARYGLEAAIAAQLLAHALLYPFLWASAFF